MQVLTYEAHNVLGVKDIKFDLAGRHLFLVGGANGQGKCLPEGTPVALWDGTTIPIEQVRDFHQVVGYDFESNALSPQNIIGLHYNGRKKCYRLRTASGHEIIATKNHRLVCEDGWRELGDFVPGDCIAVPVRLPCEGEATQEELHEAMLTGLLLGDGSLTKGVILTVADKGVHALFVNSARFVFPEVEPKVRWLNEGLCNVALTTVGGTQREGTPLRWLRELGLWGCDSFTKFIPSKFFAMGKDALRHLVAGLFATDGYIVDHDLAQFAVRSERLARGCWQALLRLGIPATYRVSEKLGKPCHYVNVTRFGWDDFARVVLPLIPPTRIRSRTHRMDGSVRSRDRIARGTGKGRSYLLPASAAIMLRDAGVAGAYQWATRKRKMGVDIFERQVATLTAPSQELLRLQSKQVCFSTVESIELIGERQTFDLEMPTGAFVANDFVVHNSSALNGLIMALAGKSGMQDYPEVALRKGENKGKLSIVLKGESVDDSITVELSLRRKASGEIIEEFKVLDSEGKKTTEPRKLLQKLFTLRAFDPLEFERMPAKEKATLVQKMLGLDLSKFDREYQKEFDKRTDLGRDGKKLASQLEGMNKHEDAPEEEIKVVELMTGLDKLAEENKARTNMEKLVEDLRVRKTDLVEDGEIILKEIGILHDQLKKKQAELEKVKADAEVAEKAEKEAEAKFAKLPDRTPDIAAIKDKIAKADETNRKVRENQAYDKLDKEVKAFRVDYQKLNDRLEKIKQERAEAVAKAKWPIDGMEMNEDGLLMNGLPFEQASTSQRIMASVAVGMALNPKLRLLVCQHGSDLDNATLDALAKVVEERDFQMIVEIVSRSKEDEERCAVVISDGEVVGAKKASDMDESSETDEDSPEE